MSQHNGARVGRLASAFLWLILPTSAANDDIISTQEPGMDRRSQARPQAPAEPPVSAKVVAPQMFRSSQPSANALSPSRRRASALSVHLHLGV
ncbi:hypothetical protein E5D57_002443 [Metarhizium anisopliae]|nr:hypothetical protein E5D57_002443 [Metarhizium anisopliae]